MSQRDSTVDDTEYGCGDTKTMKPAQKYQEENNNDVDSLSKEFSEMGCIVDTVKRPPNICVENCVYDANSNSEDEEPNTMIENRINEEDTYSDAFEDDSDQEKDIPESSSQSRQSVRVPSMLKLSKSQSSASANKSSITSGRSQSLSSVPSKASRMNMSFSNDRLREIERHNHILLSKILSARNSRKSSIPALAQKPKAPTPSAALHRKQQQRKIDHENMILLKKIQRAKSTVVGPNRR